MSELRFEGVRVRYGAGRRALDAVDSVSLVVKPGQVVGLVGESGSGKSTLARAAVGLADVAEGAITLGGVDLRRRRSRDLRRRLQMVFQDPYASLDPRMSIGESISEALSRRDVDGRAARRAEVGRLLELVNLDPGRVNLLPSHLSGGQRQRVALARALAARPAILIADEITSALDVSVQGAVLNLLRDVQREFSLGMLFISHNLAVVRYISDVIAVMYLGRLVEAGPADQVLTDPQHPYTRALLAAAPRGTAPVGPADSTEVESSELAEPPDPHAPPSGCRYHPRCAIGPRVHPDRVICRDEPPSLAGTGGHVAACHFAVAGPRD